MCAVCISERQPNDSLRALTESRASTIRRLHLFYFESRNELNKECLPCFDITDPCWTLPNRRFERRDLLGSICIPFISRTAIFLVIYSNFGRNTLRATINQQLTTLEPVDKTTSQLQCCFNKLFVDSIVYSNQLFLQRGSERSSGPPQRQPPKECVEGVGQSNGSFIEITNSLPTLTSFYREKTSEERVGPSLHSLDFRQKFDEKWEHVQYLYPRTRAV